MEVSVISFFGNLNIPQLKQKGYYPREKKRDSRTPLARHLYFEVRESRFFPLGINGWLLMILFSSYLLFFCFFFICCTGVTGNNWTSSITTSTTCDNTMICWFFLELFHSFIKFFKYFSYFIIDTQRERNYYGRERLNESYILLLVFYIDIFN